MEPTAKFKLKGDKLDSSKHFLKYVLTLQRNYNVEKFMDTPEVTDLEPFSANEQTRERQEANITKFYNDLVQMAGTITVENVKDNIEFNNYNADGNLTTTTRKARQLLRYYATLVKPNSVKDSKLMMQRLHLKFKNTDAEKLKEDLETFFNEFDEIEKEMTPRAKMVELSKMEHFHGILGTTSKHLHQALESIDIMDETLTFEDYKTRLLQSAQQIGTRIRSVNRTSSHQQQETSTLMSANSTAEMTANSTTVTMDKAEYDNMKAFISRSKQDMPRSYYGRSTSNDRKRSASNDRRRSRSNDSRGGRSPNNGASSRSPKRGRGNVTFREEEVQYSPYISSRSTSPYSRK